MVWMGCYGSKSPASQRDFKEYCETYNPELTDVIEWIKEHIDLNEIINRFEYKPDDIFDEEELRGWAKKDGWHEYISDFPQEKIDDWVEDNQDRFGNPNIKRILEDDENLNLSYNDGWVIWDIYYKQVKFSADTMEKLEKSIGEHFANIEQEEKRKQEEAEKKWKESVVAKKVITDVVNSKTASKRGRPKGSKNKSK